MMLKLSRPRPINSSLDTYLRDVREEPSLDVEEEHELAERVAEGDFEARECLTRAHLRLVITIARQYTSRHVSLEDLIEEGNLGLLRAVETFDPSRGTRFSTYAAFWIRQSIRRGLINCEGMIRLPYYTMQMLFDWRRACDRLQAELGRTPSEREAADALGWSPCQVATIRRVLHVLKANHQSESGAAPVSLDELVEVRGSTAGPFGEVDSDMVDLVLKLVGSLPKRDAQVLQLRFGLDGQSPRTLQEVGDLLGLTKARISQLEKAALRKLREQLMQDGTVLSLVKNDCD